MNITEQKEYQHLLAHFIDENPLLCQLEGKTILLTGATGMIGSFLVDALMTRNRQFSAARQTTIIALARNRRTAEQRFAVWLESGQLCFLSCDVAQELPELPVQPDYYIHAASTTHPVAYAREPVNTVLSNVFGINNLLSYMARQGCGRLLLLSSVEIYGNNRGDTEYFDEDYCGYINCNTLRAGYQEAKRVSESLCQAYIRERGVDVVTIRLPRIYGPTMRLEDSKAAAQFILNGVRGEDIVLKSEGTQLFSYAHVYDAVSGMLYVLLRGASGQAYNLGDSKSDIRLRDIAKLVADHVGKRVIFDLPDAVEKAGFSTATKALMCGDKLRGLGWHPRYDIKDGIAESVDILRGITRVSGESSEEVGK